jgi:hypothetical protein
MSGKFTADKHRYESSDTNDLAVVACTPSKLALEGLKAHVHLLHLRKPPMTSCMGETGERGC